MDSMSYRAKVNHPLRQVIALLVGFGGALLILYVGTGLLQDPAGEPDQTTSLLLVAVSILWLVLALMSQSARAHWRVSRQGIEETIEARFAWLPFGPRGTRTIQASEISGWQLGESGVGAERRPVIVFELRGQPALKIQSQHRSPDDAFRNLMKFVEQWLR